MNPKPFASLNHLTVPLAIRFAPCFALKEAYGLKRQSGCKSRDSNILYSFRKPGQQKLNGF
jgi:hypothetical protein